MLKKGCKVTAIPICRKKHRFYQKNLVGNVVTVLERTLVFETKYGFFLSKLEDVAVMEQKDIDK